MDPFLHTYNCHKLLQNRDGLFNSVVLWRYQRSHFKACLNDTNVALKIIPGRAQSFCSRNRTLCENVCFLSHALENLRAVGFSVRARSLEQQKSPVSTFLENRSMLVSNQGPSVWKCNNKSRVWKFAGLWKPVLETSRVLALDSNSCTGKGCSMMPTKTSKCTFGHNCGKQ